jgi:hypothetical protein
MSIPPAWVAPYAIILLLILSPLQREPHGPNISNLAKVLSLSVLISRMNQVISLTAWSPTGKHVVFCEGG